jgi:DNA-binding NarL/FixJ family response regulator
MSLALEDAAEYYRAALEIAAPATEARAELLNALGDLHIRLGNYDEQTRAIFEEAYYIGRQLGSARIAGEAALGFGDWFHMPGLPSDEAMVMQVEALAMLGDERSTLRVQLDSSLALTHMHSGRLPEARLVMDRAISMARDLGDNIALIWALGSAVMVETDPHVVLSHTRELRQCAEYSGNRWHILSGTTCEMRALVQLGRLAEAKPVLEHHRVMCGRIGILVADIETCCFDATIALAEGRFADAERAADEALRLGEDRHPGAPGVYGLQLFAIRRAQGRLGEVAPILELAAKRGDVGGVWRPGLAVLFAEIGRLDDAKALFEAMSADNFSALARDSLWPATLSFLADVCIAVGHTAHAAQLYDELREFEGQALQVALTICLGPADRLLGGLAGLLGRHADAERHFETAAKLAENSEAPAWRAEVECAWAAYLASTGQPQHASRLAHSALDMAEKLGMATVATRAAALATAPRLVTVPDLPDGLSAREADVLKLIAAGCSNREIGERLHISGNTAANHVRAILQKTGCANRTEAAAYAARHSLLADS